MLGSFDLMQGDFETSNVNILIKSLEVVCDTHSTARSFSHVMCTAIHKEDMLNLLNFDGKVILKIKIAKMLDL